MRPSSSNLNGNTASRTRTVQQTVHAHTRGLYVAGAVQSCLTCSHPGARPRVLSFCRRPGLVEKRVSAWLALCKPLRVCARLGPPVRCKKPENTEVTASRGISSSWPCRTVVLVDAGRFLRTSQKHWWVECILDSSTILLSTTA